MYLGASYTSLMKSLFRFLRTSCISSSRYSGICNILSNCSRIGKYQQTCMKSYQIMCQRILQNTKKHWTFTSLGFRWTLNRGWRHLGHFIADDEGIYTCRWHPTHPLSSITTAPLSSHMCLSPCWILKFVTFTVMYSPNASTTLFNVFVAQPVWRCTWRSFVQIFW